MQISEKIIGNTIHLCGIPSDCISPDYIEWMQDSEVNRFLETRHEEWTLCKIQDFVQKQNDSSDQLLLGIFVGQTHIGNIKLGPINSIHKVATISLIIGNKNYWGKGIATEAITLIKNYAFDKLGIKKLTAGLYANNLGSLKAFLKAGFSLEGIFKNHYYSVEGTRTDLLHVGCTL
ncbi:MAG: GNAT family N-acetyltransferase [Candidatus Paracaedibacteraceae bacterium]|nr:GNAT family N-acetyltransferase [Candidatus Paracaedibacteraceae bacterium]